MRIDATINERLLRRTFREQKAGRSGLTVIDRDLPVFGLRVPNNGPRTFFVRVAGQFGPENIVLGTTDDITAAAAREKALAAIAAAKAEQDDGPLLADYAQTFLSRQARRWKPSTRDSNRRLTDRYLLPFFGALRVAETTRADVRCWFDSLSGTPSNANRALPMPSVMMRQAELWEFRPQGLDPLPRNAAAPDATPRAIPVAGRAEAPRVRARPRRRPAGRGRGPAPAVHRRTAVRDHRTPVGLDPRYARSCPIRRPGPRRSSCRRPPAPSSPDCRAQGRSSFPTVRTTGR